MVKKLANRKNEKILAKENPEEKKKLATENQKKKKATLKYERTGKKLAGQISQLPQVPTRLWEWKNRNVALY